MKNKLFIIAALVLLFGINAFAQGGKAEPNRISFAKGKTSATVTGKIYGDVQAEYIFSASKGQTVTITISSVPKGKYAYFTPVNPETFEQVDEEAVNYYYKYEVQETGDMALLVKFKPKGKVKSAKYALTLSIK